MNLPESFCLQMKQLLKEEADAFFAAEEGTPVSGLRMNSLKSPELLPEHEKVPWAPYGCYTGKEETPGKNLSYFAGAYYIQEPSAMAPAEFLPVVPGDRVLDLCAAPGGKSTRLGEKLKGRGLLFSNDISVSRAQALLRNLERFGIRNLMVTAESPSRLAACFPAFFTKILVDAPCSGEGMFRKDPSLLKAYGQRGPEDYAPLQKEILASAFSMLCPGGYLLYSTCTFSPLEDEGVMEWALNEFPEMEEVSLKDHPLVIPEMVPSGHGLRFFPHRLKGEGHFLCLLKKKEAGPVSRSEADLQEIAEGFCLKADPQKKENTGAFFRGADPQNREGTASFACENGKERKAGPEKQTAVGRAGKDAGRGGKRAPLKAGSKTGLAAADTASYLSEEVLSFFGHLAFDLPKERLFAHGDELYLLPEEARPVPGLHYLRTGLFLGTVKKKRFVPSQALAMCLMPEDFDHVLSFEGSDPRCGRYLKGETLLLSEEEAAGEDGLYLICMGRYSLGFGRKTGAALKNLLDPGWRIQ